MINKKNKFIGERVDRKPARVSDKLGDLIDNGIAERVYKGIVRKPKLKI